LVLPSTEKTESFGMVLLEATHFQKPVVVTNAAGSGMEWVAKQLIGSKAANANAPASLAQALAEALHANSGGSSQVFSEAFSRFDLVQQSHQIDDQYQMVLTSAPDHVASGS
jgi:rhamnosyl/mannosyltransferase